MQLKDGGTGHHGAPSDQDGFGNFLQFDVTDLTTGELYPTVLQ